MSDAVAAHCQQAPGAPIRFVVVDDHPLVVEAIVSRVRLMRGEASFVYTGPSVFEAVQSAVAHGCDCAIVDLDLGGSMGAAEIVSSFAMHGIPVVALAERPSSAGFEEAAIAGARAYVGKCADPAHVEAATAAVLDGRGWTSREFAHGTDREPSAVALSGQELRSLVLYASGMTRHMVARRMGIAPSTVKHYLDRVRQKFTEAGYPARTKLELHAIARREGWLP